MDKDLSRVITENPVECERRSVERICFFGGPGCGKSSTMRLLGEARPDLVLIEAGRDIIRPVAQIQKLPRDIRKLTAHILDYNRAVEKEGSHLDALQRIDARATFDKCSRK